MANQNFNQLKAELEKIEAEKKDLKARITELEAKDSKEPDKIIVDLNGENGEYLVTVRFNNKAEVAVSPKYLIYLDGKKILERDLKELSYENGILSFRISIEKVSRLKIIALNGGNQATIERERILTGPMMTH